MIEAVNNARDAAAIALQFDAGLRGSELRSLTDGSNGEGALEPGQWFLTGDDVAEAGSFKTAVDQRRGDAVPSDLCLESVDVSGVRKLELLSQEQARERLLKRIRDKHGQFPSALNS